MRFQLIAVGTSLGGLNALSTILGSLPENFSPAVAVVQHRSREDSGHLTPLLRKHSQLPVTEIDDNEDIRDGRVYICPSNYHVLIEHGRFALSVDAPVMNARPSIDVLFE